MGAFIYARKSSEDNSKQVQSIEDQIKICKQIAEKKGLEVIEIFTESKSASSPGRTAFNYMLNRIEAGEAQTVVCWKLDRLSRNPLDGGKVMWMLERSSIQNIVTHEREYFPTDNMLMMHVELGMAHQFSLDLGKNAKRGMKSKCEKGWFPGVAPLGYENDRSAEKGAREIMKGELFSLVRKMWDLMLTGTYSLKKICHIANEEWGFRMPKRKIRGGGKLGTSTLYGIFINPFYYGEFKWDEEWYEGKHPPMITREEFDHVQKLLREKGRPRPKVREFVFRGMIKCGICGCSITAQENTKFLRTTKEVKKYIYYTCTHKNREIKCDQRAILEAALEEQIISFLSTVSLEEVHIQWIIDYLHEFNESEHRDTIDISKKLNNELNKCATQLSNLIDLKIRNNDLLSDEEFRDQKMRLEEEKKSIVRKLTKLNERQSSWANSAEKAVDFLRNVILKFKTGTMEEKRLILSTVGSHLVLTKGILSIQAKNEYLPLQKGIEQTKEVLSRFKPEKGRLQKGETAYNEVMYTVWLLGLDSNQ